MSGSSLHVFRKGEGLAGVLDADRRETGKEYGEGWGVCPSGWDGFDSPEDCGGSRGGGAGSCSG